MLKILTLTLLCLLFVFSGKLIGQIIAIEVFGGVPYNIKSPLLIEQEGEKDIFLRARYISRPFQSPVFALARIVGKRTNSERFWEVELLHHKIYLNNKPSEVQSFSVSHGLNLLNVSAGKGQHFNLGLLDGIIPKIGFGLVIAHPENTVRTLELNQQLGVFRKGYYLCGGVLNVAFQKKFDFFERLYGSLELKFTPSVSVVPVVNGRARVINLPVQFNFGLGSIVRKQVEEE